jgi:hemolysin activation/secretion protein
MRPARLFACALLAGLLSLLAYAPAGFTQPAPTAAAAEDKPPFDVLEYRIEGNTVLPTLTIEEAVYPHLGEGKTIDDVDAARAALEKAYQDAGYLTVLVDLPEQQVKGGVVTLRVTEGRVGKLKVSGNRYYSRGAIRAKVPELAEGNVPYFPQVQTELAALSRTPDRQVTPVLKPGQSPGKLDVDLQVKDAPPLHGGVEVNNRQTPNTEDLRVAGFLRYDNLWQREHSFSLTYQTAPEDRDQTEVWSGTYVLPVAGTGWLLAGYYINSKSDVAAVGSVNVIGSGDIWGLRAIRPLPQRPGFFHSLNLGIDYKDFAETTSLLGADSFETPISYAPLTAGYSATLQGNAYESQLNAAVVLGVRDLFGNDDREFAIKRFNARANYAILRGDAVHTQRFGAWEGVGRLALQVTDQPLISNEQFAAGGVDSVRGYLEAEQFGDNGIRGSLELRTPRFALGEDTPIELVGLAFLDGAHLRIKDALPGQDASITLSSIGVGLRLKAWKGLSALLDVGWPFHETQYTEKHDPRAHFRVGYEF